jgi:hypothetical protein
VYAVNPLLALGVHIQAPSVGRGRGAALLDGVVTELGGLNINTDTLEMIALKRAMRTRHRLIALGALRVSRGGWHIIASTS